MIAAILEEALKSLETAGCETPRLDAEVLLAFVLKCKRFDLYKSEAKKISPPELKQFQKFVERRKKREPVAYITGVKEFWSIPIKVTPDVLIPRPETEMVVEKVLSFLNQEPTQILDLCTGSGCIAAALALELPHAEILATDISQKALKIAKENLKPFFERITLLQSDLFEKVEGLFDIIVSNPPYIPSFVCDELQPEVSQFEPRLALDGGREGLDFVRAIEEDGKRFLKPGGILLIENGSEIFTWKN